MGIGGKKKRPRKINFGGRASWSGARGKHTYTTFFLATSIPLFIQEY
jgi:hypothetical protein